MFKLLARTCGILKYLCGRDDADSVAIVVEMLLLDPDVCKFLCGCVHLVYVCPKKKKPIDALFVAVSESNYETWPICRSISGWLHVGVCRFVVRTDHLMVGCCNCCSSTCLISFVQGVAFSGVVSSCLWAHDRTQLVSRYCRYYFYCCCCYFVLQSEKVILH